MLTVTTLALPRKPAPPIQETRVAPRPHVRMETYAVPLRRTVRPVPDDPRPEPFGAVRVRGGMTYDLWTKCDYWYDAAEARSGLVGHEA